MIVTVPNIVGLSEADAATALETVGLVLGTSVPAVNPNVEIGDIAFQMPAAYAQVQNTTPVKQYVIDSQGNQVYDSNGNPLFNWVLQPTPVNVGISSIAISPNVDPLTIISQYPQSPVLTALIDDFEQYFDQSANWNNFYQYVWNIDTAQGFGLDFWGQVLGVTRYLTIPGAVPYLGLNSAAGASGVPFGEGVFYDGATSTETYRLTDAQYQQLLFAKAFANICRTCIPVMNQLLGLLFEGLGDAYVLDNGNMQMTYYFGFTLTNVQLAIVEQSGVMPHPTGVSVTITEP